MQRFTDTGRSGPSPDSGRLCSDLGLAAPGSGRERLGAHAQRGTCVAAAEHTKAPALLQCPPRGRRTPVSADGAPHPAPPKASRELPKWHTQAPDPVRQRCRGGPGSQVIPAVTEVSAALGDAPAAGQVGLRATPGGGTRDKGQGPFQTAPKLSTRKPEESRVAGRTRRKRRKAGPSPGQACAQTAPAVCHQGLRAPRGAVAGPKPRGAPRSASGAAVWPTSEGAANSNRLRFKAA